MLGSVCLKLIDTNCQTSQSNSNICEVCRVGLWLLPSGACSECYNGYSKYTDGSINKCKQCTDTNCKHCDSTGACNECKPTYFLKTDQSCSKCTDTGYAKSADANNVATCVACIPDCTNCIYNYISSVWTCASCDSSKKVQFSDNTKCIDCPWDETNTPIGEYCYQSGDCSSNCKKCISSTECVECQPYYYVSENLHCLPCINDCVTCFNAVQSCIECTNSKFLFPNICFDCPTSGYARSDGKILFFFSIQFFLQFFFFKYKHII